MGDHKVEPSSSRAKDSDQDSAEKQNSAATDTTNLLNTEPSCRSLEMNTNNGKPPAGVNQCSQSIEVLSSSYPLSDDEEDEDDERDCCDFLPKPLQPGLRGGLKSISRFRKICGMLVNDSIVQYVIVALIILNAIILGVATFDFVTDNDEVADVFSKVDKAFLVVFTVEMGMQLIYHGYRFFLDGWLFFDFAIVILSWSLDSLSVLRAFRVMRTIRLVTRLKSLKNLLNAIFDVGPSVTATMALLLLIMYIYAVLCTELFGDMFEKGQLDDNYFGRLDNSLFTLLELSTMEWANIVRQVEEVHGWWAAAIFTSFLVLTGFILYSLIIAIICDAVADNEHKDEIEEKRKEETESRLRLSDMRSRVQELTMKQKEAMQSIQTALDQLGEISDKEQQMTKSRGTLFSLSFWDGSEQRAEVSGRKEAEHTIEFSSQKKQE
mmetsp:Transcript_14128/g.39042  ORF Transcript_14128/g.39042 Transcript_14128/m.39042 type:complete len:436 (-) Transcript_14128:2356-3663(-)